MLRRSLLVLVGLSATVVLGFSLTDAHASVRQPLLVGEKHVEHSSVRVAAGRSEASRFRAVRSGTAATVVVYLASSNRAKVLHVAIYTNSGSLLSSGSRRHPKAGAWNRVTIHPARLVARRVYWLALFGSGGTLAYRGNSRRACSPPSHRADVASFPAHWRNQSSAPQCSLSAYAVGRVQTKHRKHSSSPATPAKPPYHSTPAPPPSSPPPPTSFPGTQHNCVSDPTACGYPDATNSGVPAGTSLTPSSGTINAGTPDETISNLDLHGTINVTASNVTIKDVRITSGDGTLGANWAINIAQGVSGTQIDYTTILGNDCQAGSLMAGVWNASGDQLTMDHDYGSCLDDILHGSGTLSNSYSFDNANIPSDHYEPVAYDGGAGAITVNHDTLLNPHDQTAAVFVTCYSGPVTSETIENSLLAGGDYVIYGPTGNGPCDSATGHQTVVNNRFSNAFFPNGGYYGIADAFQRDNTTWSGNVWDDSLAAAQM